MEEGHLNLIVLIGTTLLLGLAVALILLLTISQKKKLINLQEKQALKVSFEEELLKSQLEIQENTLTEVGEEIHDNIGQTLSVARLYLSAAEELSSGEEKQKIAQASEQLAKAIRDLRALSHTLQSESVEKQGLCRCLSNECERIASSGKLAAEFQSLGDCFGIPAQVETILFRMCQEALNNAIKHSGAKRLLVNLHWEAAALRISIADDGRGFRTDQNLEGGKGFSILRKRATLTGSKLSILSTPGKGTHVTILFPKPDSNSQDLS